MRHPILLTSLFMGFLLLYSSCITSGHESAEQEEILGKWELEEAYRNGKKTTLLEGYYFDFQDNGKVTTNFNLEGKEETLEYQMREGGKIELKGSESDFKAEMDLDGHLILKTIQLGSPFRLVMRPATTEEE